MVHISRCNRDPSQPADWSFINLAEERRRNSNNLSACVCVSLSLFICFPFSDGLTDHCSMQLQQSPWHLYAGRLMLLVYDIHVGLVPRRSDNNRNVNGHIIIIILYTEICRTRAHTPHRNTAIKHNTYNIMYSNIEHMLLCICVRVCNACTAASAARPVYVFVVYAHFALSFSDSSARAPVVLRRAVTHGLQHTDGRPDFDGTYLPGPITLRVRAPWEIRYGRRQIIWWWWYIIL